MTRYEHSLQSDTVLNNYTIVKVLGAGGFGITYLAKDKKLELEVVIKEYFPNELAVRKDDSTIISKSSDTQNDFKKGMQRFEEEAQTLAKFDHPSIVKILGYFEANNTAYFVMEYEEGIDLNQYMKQKNKPFTQDEIFSIIMPILEGLKEVHKHNYLHRDIKPANILLRQNKGPVLIDFGASKLAIGEASKSVTSMLTEGYAPLEQYNTDIKQQGAFTDIYAMAAVIYKMITRELPPSAQTRSYNFLQDGKDPFKSLSKMKLSGYDKTFLKAIDRALSIKAKDRQQTIGEFQSDISNIQRRQDYNKPRNRWLIFTIIFLIVFGGLFLLYQYKEHQTVLIQIEKYSEDTKKKKAFRKKQEIKKVEEFKLLKEKEESKKQQVEKSDRLEDETKIKEQLTKKQKEKKSTMTSQKQYLFDTSGITDIAIIGKPMKSVIVPNIFESRNTITRKFAEGDYYDINIIYLLKDNKILAEIRGGGKVIDEILIYSDIFVTDKGAKVGMNLTQFLNLYPNKKLVHTSIEDCFERFFVTVSNNIQFDIDKNNYIGNEKCINSENVFLNELKKTSAIKNIRIYQRYKDTTEASASNDLQLSRNFNNDSRSLYPYVCYKNKIYLSNGKSKYENCIRENVSCSSLGKSHFGKYPNDLKAHEAFERCLRSGIQ